MAINTNAQNVIIGDSLVDYCTYQESASRYAIPGKNHMGQPMMIPIGEHILSRHMLLLGGIGTGKSNAFNHIIRNTRSNLTNEDVMIIFDTKGDFYKEFYRPGDVVISNDARATGGSEADYWNIFEEVTIDDRVEENILEIAKGLFAEKLEHTTQPFFPNAAKDLFAALMLHLVRNDKFADKRNNKSLRSYLNSITPHIMVDILNQHSDLKAMQSYIYDEKSGQTLGVMAELQQMMREIFIGNFQKKGGLSMRKLVRRKGGRVIFVEYDLGIGGMLMPIYRLLIDLAIKEALCRTSNEGNVYFFIDEFRLVPHLEHIDDGVNFGRSLGAKFFVGIQNIDQVMAAYGEYTGRSILSGFGTTFAFRVNDVGSREYIKNLFGRNIKQQSYMSKVQNRGIAEQLREGYVVEDDDINNLPVGEAIVSAPSGEPFRFKLEAVDLGVTSDYLCSYSSDRLLTDSDVEGYLNANYSEYNFPEGINIIQMIINEIYAKHGYEFTDSKLSAYFSNKTWYKSNTNKVNDMNAVSDSMSEIEKKNVDFLNSYR